MRIDNQKDFVAGLFFTATGIAFAWGATDYTIGTSARMGPGYFPLMLGVLLAILGSIITARAVWLPGEGEKIGRWAWRPLACILGANLVFGVLLGGLPSLGVPPMGLMVAIYALTLIAATAGEKFVLHHVLLLATVLAVGSYLAFVVLLQLPLPVWPRFVSA